MVQGRAALLFVAVLAARGAFAADGRPERVAAASGAALAEWSSKVDGLLRSRQLVPRLTREDTMIAGRTHERLARSGLGIRSTASSLSPPASSRKEIGGFSLRGKAMELKTVARPRAQARYGDCTALKVVAAPPTVDDAFRSRMKRRRAGMRQGVTAHQAAFRARRIWLR